MVTIRTLSDALTVNDRIRRHLRVADDYVDAAIHAHEHGRVDTAQRLLDQAAACVDNMHT